MVSDIRVLRELALGIAAIVTTISAMVSGCASPDASLQSSDLSSEAVNGISLMEKVDQGVLEAAFGALTREGRPEGIRTLSFEDSAYSVSVNLDDSDRVTGISAGFTGPPGPRTSRGIGAGSSLSDVVSAYGENYRKESYSNFMGGGNGYVLFYTDREHGSTISFVFNEGDPYLDRGNRKTRLLGIRLYRR